MENCHLNQPITKETPLCLFGVRPCDIAAMQIQDKVFVTGTYRDERYARPPREYLYCGS